MNIFMENTLSESTMNRKNPLITGTIILTLTGLISRVIGFFYRIYLSRAFGEENLGVYQLLAPITALTFSLCCAGLQTAISKYVAGETTTHDYKASGHVLLTGLFLALSTSACCSILIYHHSETIASHFLLEPRTASMLRILSLSIPMEAVHSCINGYFYGVKKASIPAGTQLVEQVSRVGCVFFFCSRLTAAGGVPSIQLAVLGLVTGECAASLVSIIAIYFRFYRLSSMGNSFLAKAVSVSPKSLLLIARRLLAMALPLSANRIILNALQSIEAVYIPNRLQLYGFSVADSFRVLGVLNGMAMPLILFPNALTGSLSVLLLPVVAEADSTGQKAVIEKAVSKTIRCCAVLGVCCTIFFLLSGRFLGTFLFHSPLAGQFIITLSFICPFLYLNTTLSGIMHGLGKAVAIFLISVSSLFIRLIFVFGIMTHVGIKGYMWGILASQMYTCFLTVFLLKRTLYKKNTRS